MTFTVSQIAEQLQGEVLGDGSIRITGFAPANSACPGDLTFAEKESFLAAAEESEATAILVPMTFTSTRKILIRVANARVAVARVLPLFFRQDELPCGIHPTATIAETAMIDPSAHVGPNCMVRDRVRIGARSVLAGGNDIGRDCQIGEDVWLHPNVVLYAGSRLGHRVVIHAGTVIGSDGYSYVFDQGVHRKMMQVGTMIIEDDVEIGANAAIDRGALGPTIIGKGTKIDNLVHVAHNVTLGRHCLVMGQVGFAGSTHVGDYSVIASQSGIAGHLHLGRQVTVGAKSGVMRDIPDGSRVLGIPATPDKQAKRQIIAAQQLPALLRMRELERELAEVKAALK